jgi:hypothetical protein
MIRLNLSQHPKRIYNILLAIKWFHDSVHASESAERDVSPVTDSVVIIAPLPFARAQDVNFQGITRKIILVVPTWEIHG